MPEERDLRGRIGLSRRSFDGQRFVQHPKQHAAKPALRHVSIYAIGPASDGFVILRRRKPQRLRNHQAAIDLVFQEGA